MAGLTNFFGGGSVADGVVEVQRAFFETISTRSLIHSEFTDPPGATNTTPNLRAVTAGAGAIVAGSIADPINHPGIWRLLTGSTATGRVFIISIAGGIVVGTFRIGGGVLRTGTWLRTESNLSTALERYVLRSGLFSISLPNVILEGIGFEYQDDENNGRWQLIGHDGIMETSVDSGVTVAADTWYKLEFEVNVAGSSVEFFIDNVSVGLVTTTLPLGSAFHLFYNTHIMKLVGTTSREMSIDAMYVYQEINR